MIGSYQAKSSFSLLINLQHKHNGDFFSPRDICGTLIVVSSDLRCWGLQTCVESYTRRQLESDHRLCVKSPYICNDELRGMWFINVLLPEKKDLVKKSWVSRLKNMLDVHIMSMNIRYDNRFSDSRQVTSELAPAFYKMIVGLFATDDRRL